MKIARWGNSLAVRLPASLVETLGLKEGEEIEVLADEPRALTIRRTLTRDEAIQELRRFRGMMPRGFKFSRDEANER